MTGAVRLDNRVQRYPWGSKTAIPALTGRAAGDGPEAELWIGAHPSAPSGVLLEDGPRPLDAWLAEAPEARLGPEIAARFGGLPFLLKYLAADAPLSIQCHPNAEQAAAGFAREEAAGVPRDARTRTYRDPNPKPELIVARGHFEALEGFRRPEQIIEMVRRLDRPTVSDLLAPLEAAPDRGGLETFYRALMTLPAHLQAATSAQVVSGARTLADTDPAFDWVVRLGEAYPGDLGVLSPLLLHHVVLDDEEALYLGAGELHAYLGGTGVEIMASSDNVVRGGLTGKHVDVPELLDLLTFDTSGPEILRPEPAGLGLFTYRTPAEHFELHVIRPTEAQPVALPRGGRPAALLGLEGKLELSTDGAATTPLAPGQALFLPADAPGGRLTGAGEAVCATVPSRDRNSSVPSLP